MAQKPTGPKSQPSKVKEAIVAMNAYHKASQEAREAELRAAAAKHKLATLRLSVSSDFSGTLARIVEHCW